MQRVKGGGYKGGMSPSLEKLGAQQAPFNPLLLIFDKIDKHFPLAPFNHSKSIFLLYKYKNPNFGIFRSLLPSPVFHGFDIKISSFKFQV